MPPETHPLASTPLFRLVEERLRHKRHPDFDPAAGVGLLDWFIQQRRSQRISYRRIANDLITQTGIDVTSEAVRRWHVSAVTGADDPPAEQPAA